MNSADRSQTDQADSRPSRAEFRVALSASRHRLGWTAFGVFVGLLTVQGGFLLAMGVVRLDPVWGWLLAPLALLPWVIAGTVLVMSLNRPLLTCRSCRHSLGLGKELSIPIVTGRCPKCAKPLFSDSRTHGPIHSEESPTAYQLLTLAELKVSERKALQASIRPTLTWAISGGVLLVLGIASLPWAKAALSAWVGEIWAPFIIIFLPFPGMAIGFWAVVIWERCIDRARRTCPNCHSRLGYASRTGNCSSCGRPAVSDPFPGMEPAPEPLSTPHARWTVAEYVAEAKRQREHSMSSVLVGLVLLIAFQEFLKFLPLSWPFAPPSLRDIVALACFGGGFVLLVLGVSLWERHSARRLRCPECRNELLMHFSPLVVSSHRCYHCGCEVLKDE